MARGVNFQKVYEILFFYPFQDLTSDCHVRDFFCQYDGRKDACHGCFPRSAWTGEDIRVGDFLAFHCSFQRLDDMILSNNSSEGFRPVFSVERHRGEYSDSLSPREGKGGAGLHWEG